MDNFSFQNKRRDLVVKRQFEQLSSLLTSSVYQIISANRIRYASIIIAMSMLFLFLGVAFIDSIVLKIVIFLIFTMIAAPLTSIIISIDRTVFTVKNIAKNEHLNKINSSRQFYTNIDPFEDHEDIKMLMGKEDYNLLKFMDTYVEEKSVELSKSVENTFSEIMSTGMKISSIGESESDAILDASKVHELETFISEYEDVIDVFNHCRMSIIMIHLIESLSGMSIEDFKQKIDNVQDEEEMDRIKRTGFYIGDTMILADDIQYMINDKETVKFMMEINKLEYFDNES